MRERRVAFLTCLLLGAGAVASARALPPLSRWVSPDGSKPGTYADWTAGHPSRPFSWKLARVSGGTDFRNVAIIVESGLAAPLDSDLTVFTANLRQAGYTSLLYEVSGGTPESLKALLQNAWTTHQIEGALFVGDLPVAWYQIKVDPGNRDNYSEWPIDLFYMDLDGLWLDTMRYDPVETLVRGSDHVYDAHTGRVQPEIYVARLAPNGMGDRVELLHTFFQKDDAFRHDTLPDSPRALVFIDDDWASWAEEWNQDVGFAFPERELCADPETTRASIYRDKLSTPYVWVSVFAHAGSRAYGFYFDQHQQMDYFYGSEYTSQVPPADFYNHFACSFCRYTDTGYGGGRSVFTPSHGLAALGSTRAGSMLYFDQFYCPLRDGRSLGQAYRAWFSWLASNGYYSSESVYWFYGMTLLGDPFFTVAMLRDAVLDRVMAPSENVVFDTTLTPTAVVSCDGNLACDATAWLRIGDGYSDTQRIGLMNPGDSAVVCFRSWQARNYGNFALVCSISAPGENCLTNNTLRRNVLVFRPDIEAKRITSPAGLRDTTPFAPAAAFLNRGGGWETFRTRFVIQDSAGNRVYEDSQTVSELGQGVQRVVTFASCTTARREGRYSALACALRPGDRQPGNDTAREAFEVRRWALHPASWAGRAPLPTARKRTGFKAGGSLAYASEGQVYALKGGGRLGFYCYDPILDAWADLESLPARGSSGRKKGVGPGGALAFAGGALYATKGSKTREFWQYDRQAGWREKASLPELLNQVLDGAALVGVMAQDRPYVYFIQGKKRWGFYRYDVLGDSWQWRSIPGSAGGNAPPHGWGMAWDGDDTIFALKSDFNELQAYSIAGDVWTMREALPLRGASGKKKKVKYGSLAYRDRTLYGLKGGGTNQLWRYDCGARRWTECDSVPRLGKPRGIGKGGAVVSADVVNSLLVTRGGGSDELWRYQLDIASQGVVQPDAAALTRIEPSLAVSPNPFTRAAVVSYAVPQAEFVSLRLYDALGRLRANLVSRGQPAGRYTLRLDAASLARGVYVLRLETRKSRLSQKLVIE
jgi:hypothetical protein